MRGIIVTIAESWRFVKSEFGIRRPDLSHQCPPRKLLSSWASLNRTVLRLDSGYSPGVSGDYTGSSCVGYGGVSAGSDRAERSGYYLAYEGLDYSQVVYSILSVPGLGPTGALT